MTSIKISGRVPEGLYRRFVEKAEKLGISKSQALREAIIMWVQATAQPHSQNIQPPQVQQPIVIVVPWPFQGQITPLPIQQISQSLPNLSQAPNTPKPEAQKEDALLVVPRKALVEPEKSEAVKAEGAIDTQGILEEIMSNPWVDILQRKGEKSD